MNPQMLIQQVLNNSQMMQNPMMRNAVQMYQQNDIKGLQNLANNLCKEKGYSSEEISNQIKNIFRC